MNRPLLSAQASALRTSVWPVALAALLVVGLLVTFHQVVQGAVDQAMLRRQAAAQHAEADWQCRTAPAQVRSVVLTQAGSTTNGRAGCQPPQ